MSTLDNYAELYRKYQEELCILIDNMRVFLRRGRFDLMLSDIEMEMSYIRVREYQPKKIVEFSPNTGWSTCALSLAAEKNDNGATIYTYDIQDKCSQNFKELGRNNVVFHHGDVREHFKDLLDADYYFIDSDHKEEFANNYINNLLLPLVDSKRRIGISVHDIFHNPPLTTEAITLLKVLESRKIPYHYIRAKQEEVFSVKREFKLDQFHLHQDQLQTILFIDLPCT